MKTLVLVVLLFAVFAGCPGQVQVPSANIQPVLDSLTVLKARVAVLEAKPSVNVQPLLDSIAVLKARVATLESQAILTKTGTTTFSGTSWRKAVYIPGLTTAWRVSVWPVYSIDTPVIDYVVRRELKTDSLIIIRQPNGTANLAVEYIGVLP